MRTWKRVFSGTITLAADGSSAVTTTLHGEMAISFSDACVLAVLCGWGLIHLKLAEAGLHKHIVIQESSIRYLQPVRADMRAACRVDDAALDRFLRVLRRSVGGSQLVMITHNKRSMELADILYGVTMPEPGVSRIVSMAARIISGVMSSAG